MGLHHRAQDPDEEECVVSRGAALASTSSSDSSSISESQSSADRTRTADGEVSGGYSSSIGSRVHVTLNTVLSPSCRTGPNLAKSKSCSRSSTAGDIGGGDGLKGADETGD